MIVFLHSAQVGWRSVWEVLKCLSLVKRTFCTNLYLGGINLIVPEPSSGSDKAVEISDIKNIWTVISVYRHEFFKFSSLVFHSTASCSFSIK